MSADASDGDRGDTRTAIMEATYRALCRHGSADLTIQAIADEFEKSKSLLYYHYETKDDLLLDFLDWLLDRWAAELREDEADDVESFVDRVLPRELGEEREEFRAAFVEIRARAATDPDYRERFTRSDDLFRETLRERIELGVERGDYREVDPAATADLLMSVIDGAMVRRATTDADVMAATREGVDEYVARVLRGGE